MTQRTALNFWLLLVATLCVNAGAVVACRASDWSNWSTTLYLGLAFGQLSVACIWATAERGLKWRQLLPYVGGLIAAMLAAPVEMAAIIPWSQFVLAFGLLFALHVTNVYAGLWLLDQTRFGRRSALNDNAPTWQLTMKQLLAITTVVALLLTVATHVKIFGQDDFVAIGPWTLLNACLAAAAVWLSRLQRNIVLRIAMLTVVAFIAWFVLCVVVAAFSKQSGSDGGMLLTVELIQTVVLIVWLEVGLIKPLPEVADDGQQMPSDPGPSVR